MIVLFLTVTVEEPLMLNPPVMKFCSTVAAEPKYTLGFLLPVTLSISFLETRHELTSPTESPVDWQRIVLFVITVEPIGFPG